MALEKGEIITRQMTIVSLYKQNFYGFGADDWDPCLLRYLRASLQVENPQEFILQGDGFALSVIGYSRIGLPKIINGSSVVSVHRPPLVSFHQAPDFEFDRSGEFDRAFFNTLKSVESLDNIETVFNPVRHLIST